MSNDRPVSYNGNPYVKAAGVKQSYTEKEISEYLKCRNDPAYFARSYVKVINLDRGLVPFDLYPYQEKMFKHFNDNRFSIVLACRQSGKSISSVAWILWYAIFHADKTIAILANKGATAREMLSRLTLALENLPFFLQPGCTYLNKGSIGFDNHTKIVAAATTASSIRGQSCNVIFLDEFAFVQNATEFYTSTYPVISSGKDTKVIITSTANGVGNQFYKLWSGAITGRNEFKYFRVDWWDVPGRDDAWKKQTISNTSELQFEQEFGNSFISTSDTLLSSDVLLGLKAQSPNIQRDKVCIYAMPEENHQYIMTVDVSKGRGQDFSTFTIMDVTSTPFKQVATFKDNVMSPLIFPDIIIKYAKLYNMAWIIVENNDAGAVVCNAIYYEYEYENMFVESAVKMGGIGVTMTKKVKRIGCSNLKDLVEMGKLEIVDSDTISEMSTFQLRGSSYEAEDGNHDDLVMNLVMFAWFVSSEAFGDNISTKTLKEILFGNVSKQVEEDIVPVGEITSSNSRSMNPIYDQMLQDLKDFNAL